MKPLSVCFLNDVSVQKISTRLSSAKTKWLCVNYQKLNAHLPTVFGSKISGAITVVDIP